MALCYRTVHLSSITSERHVVVCSGCAFLIAQNYLSIYCYIIVSAEDVLGSGQMLMAEVTAKDKRNERVACKANKIYVQTTGEW